MKRIVREGHDGTSDKRASGSKRAKANHACASCRKNKTRCDLPDMRLGGPARCRRCEVLSTPCSFENDTPFLPHGGDSFAHDAALQVAPSDAVVLGADDLVRIVDTDPASQRCINTAEGWAARPMLTMQAMMRKPVMPSTSGVENLMSMTSFLRDEQIVYLLEVFESRYSPWMNLEPHQPCEDPFLRLAHCTVAARHLDLETRIRVTPHLHTMCDDALARYAFSPRQSTHVVQALMTMALWSRMDDYPRNKVHDSHMIITCASRMAMNLHLHDSTAIASTLQKKKREGHDLSSLELSQLVIVTEKARLWLSVSNADWSLCIGTVRIPISPHLDHDPDSIEHTSFQSIQKARDKRLGLMNKLLVATGQGLRMRLSGASPSVIAFHQSMEHDVLRQMGRLLTQILPIPSKSSAVIAFATYCNTHPSVLHLVVTEHEAPHFTMLLVFHYLCQLQVYFHGLRELWRFANIKGHDGPGESWITSYNIDGTNIVSDWGLQSVITAQAAFSALLAYTNASADDDVIFTAPDNMFAMLLFAAAFLVRVMHTSLCLGGVRDQHIPSEVLLTRLVTRLDAAAESKEHMPARCAKEISALLASWNRPDMPADAGGPSSGNPVRVEASNQPLEDGNAPQFAYDGSDFEGWGLLDIMDSDTMLDFAFWSSVVPSVSDQSMRS